MIAWGPSEVSDVESLAPSSTILPPHYRLLSEWVDGPGRTSLVARHPASTLAHFGPLWLETNQVLLHRSSW
jgi:hypothetical protein